MIQHHQGAITMSKPTDDGQDRTPRPGQNIINAQQREITEMQTSRLSDAPASPWSGRSATSGSRSQVNHAQSHGAPVDLPALLLLGVSLIGLATVPR